MDLGLKDRVAIVTGGARGIGKGISECLAAEGARLAVCDILHDIAAATAKEISGKYGVEAIGVSVDVSDESSVNNMVDAAVRHFGKVDILVNNAGVFPPGWVEELTEADWDKPIDVNLKGTFLCSRAVIPYMKKQRYGRIINAASIAGLMPDVGISAYSVSKAGIINFTMALGGELAPFNITVNSYAPGIIKTPMTEDMIRDRGDVQVKQMPLNRFGEPEDVGYLVTFLASKQAGYITGVNIPVAGGQLIVQNPWRAYDSYGE